MAEKSVYDQMLAGEPYDGTDPALFELKKAGVARKATVDAIDADDMTARHGALAELFGGMAGMCVVMPPFTVEYGRHIHLGEWVFINSGVTLLDSNRITIGDRAAIGPNAQLLTVTHPKKPEDRHVPVAGDRFVPYRVTCIAKPIEIGKACWIGAGAIILPGVVIGEGAVVGAGAVVTKSVPARAIAVGNPARVTGTIDD